MKVSKRHLVLIVLLVAVASQQVASGKPQRPYQYSKAEIYCVGWNVMFRGPLPLETIRKKARVQITISEPPYATGFAWWLKLDQLRELEAVEAAFPYLVVDLFDGVGNRSTYYASPFRLYSEDGRRARDIDDAFKDRFRFGEEAFRE